MTGTALVARSPGQLIADALAEPERLAELPDHRPPTASLLVDGARFLVDWGGNTFRQSRDGTWLALADRPLVSCPVMFEPSACLS